MKKLCLLLAAVLVLTTAAAFGTAEEPAFRDAHAVLEDMGLGWNLGNSLDAWSGKQTRVGPLSSETVWSNPMISRELIALVKASGFGTVRLPVTWFNHMDPQTYEIDSAWMDRVEEVVGYILDEGMYCVLNVHHDTGSDNWLTADPNNYAAKEEKFTAIWRQIAERFAPYGEKLLFEGYNEILNDAREWTNPRPEDYDAANQLNQAFVDTVRAAGGNNAERCLVVNTYGAQPNSQVTQGMQVPTDTAEDRIIVEAHVYTPFQFTSENYPNVKMWDKGSVDSCMGNLDRNFLQKGYPVLIGEFGAVEKDNFKARMAWTKYVVDRATALGIGCVWWDNGGDYQLISRRTLSVTQPELIALMLTEASGGDYEITDEIVAQYQARLTPANLCETPEKWYTWIDTANGGKADVRYSAEGAEVTVTASGTEAWHVQPSYTKLTLEEGATYRLSFDYRADPAQPVAYHVMKDYGDYASYQEGHLEAAPEFRHFECEFTLEGPTDKNCKIAFDLGGSAVTVPFDFEVHNLTLIKTAGK